MQEFEDPFDLGRQSRPSGQSTLDGREIRLVGQPILADNSVTNSLTDAAQFFQHRWVKNRHFYTLPIQLWNALVNCLGEASFDPEVLRMERILAACCGDHSSVVGIWNEGIISYYGLRPMRKLSVSDDDFQAVGIDPLVGRQAVRTYNERDAVAIERFRRGYIGWLMTNQQFLDEHDALLAEHAGAVRAWGTHLAGIVLPISDPPALFNPATDDSWRNFNTACETFFARWRLMGLAGPYLPIPLEALMAGVFPLTVVQHLNQTGGLFYLPDTMPIPSRDQMRGMLEDALRRRTSAEHLSEWREMIHSSNSAKNRLDSFCRMFEIQHFWRLLHQRHSRSLTGKVGRIERALGEFVGKSPQSIHGDMMGIRRRLGRDWLERSWPI